MSRVAEMFNKKSIELSLNFIVILVISIVIFGFGVKFIYNLSSQATDLQQLTTNELDEKIGNLVCESSERVCVGIDRKTIQRTKFDVFGLKILNILDDRDFQIAITPSNPIGYARDKSPISCPPLNSCPSLIINPQIRDVDIQKNEERTVGIGVKVPDNANSGTYILNVDIKVANQQYVPVQKLYVVVP